MESQTITSKNIEIPKYALLLLFEYSTFFTVYILLDSYNNSPITFVALRFIISVLANTIITILIDLALINKYIR
jgi:hypothetical protein